MPFDAMRDRLRNPLLLLLIALCLGATPTYAQSSSSDTYVFSQDELDELVAPIALYPDDLLTEILMAATYPLEVVQAARFVQENPGLTDQALEDAVADRNWDPSVQSLSAFPEVLAMMNDKLDWTQRLGDAFIGQQQQVMDTIQKLRERAREAGNLNSTSEQSVVDQDNSIVIDPAQPDYVYVPVYDPTIVYGPWWAPDYVPWYWVPPPIYGYPYFAGVGVFFGRRHRPSRNHWGWARPDWHGHSVHVDVGRNPILNQPRYRQQYAQGVWQHLPEHRRGVSYRDSATRSRLINVDPAAAQARLNYRGREPTPALATPTPQRSPQVPNTSGRPSPVPAPQAPTLASPRGPMSGNVQREAPTFAPRSSPAPPRAEQGFNRTPTPVASPAFRQPVVLPSVAPPVFRQPMAAAPVFNPAPRNQVEIESNRGRASLGAPVSRAAPAAHR